MKRRRIYKKAGLVLLVVGLVSGVAALLVRDQISRHRRNLFSAHPLRRLAALGYLAGDEASIDAVQLLRDYIAWEERPLLRRRATLILERMERQFSDLGRVRDRVVG